MSDNIYDCIIIGGGPAGLSAGIYASRARLNSVLVEKLMPGGQVLLTSGIENYPGFGKGTQGPDLMAEMCSQAKALGLEILTDEITGVRHVHKDGHKFILDTSSGKNLDVLSIIVATGAHWNKLNVPGEEKLIGKGISYCATCDGPLAKGK